MAKYSFGKIDHIILFGGSRATLEIARWAQQTNLSLDVFTAPRQLDDVVGDEGETFEQLLKLNSIHYRVSQDINQEADLLSMVTDKTLGIGLGEAWSFEKTVIDAFDGRLLDIMGIPLPKYRGGAHYTWLLQRKERQWAVNLQVINEDMVQGEFDSGEILYSKRYLLPEHLESPQNVFDFASNVEKEFVAEFISKVSQGESFDALLPDESESLFFPRLNTLKHGWINWQWTCEEIVDFIRSFGAPYAGASTHLNEERVFIHGAKIASTEKFHPFQSGLITRIFDDKIYIIAKDGLIVCDKLVNSDGHQVSLKTGMRLFTPMKQLEEAMMFQCSY